MSRALDGASHSPPGDKQSHRRNCKSYQCKAEDKDPCDHMEVYISRRQRHLPRAQGARCPPKTLPHQALIISEIIAIISSASGGTVAPVDREEPEGKLGHLSAQQSDAGLGEETDQRSSEQRAASCYDCRGVGRSRSGRTKTTIPAARHAHSILPRRAVVRTIEAGRE
jgi:hypothetical protein